MLELLLFISLFNVGYSELFKYCELMNNEEECLYNTFCAWCNTTNVINNTITYEPHCIFKNTCSRSFNDTNCVMPKNIDYKCNFTFLVLNTIIIFIFGTTTYSFIYSFKKMVSEDSYKKHICLFSLLTISIVVIPSSFLWFTNSDYFLPYLLALIVLSFICCCCGTTSNYRKNRGSYYNYTRLN